MHPMRPIPLLIGLSILLSSCTQTGITSGRPPSANARCEPDYRAPNWTAFARTLSEQRARWDALGHKNYDMTQAMFSLIYSPPTRVEIRGGQVVSATIISAGQAVPADRLASFPTVDALYAYYTGLIERERRNPESCVTLNIAFDSMWPIPSRISSGDRTRGLQDAFGTILISDYTPRP